MILASTVQDLRREILARQKEGDSVGFVPTMGALHPGHLSLLKRAREENTFTVTSIFVNPTQFNDPEDLKKYPRTPDKDMALLEQAGCDLVLMPPVEEIYPPAYQFTFNVGFLDTIMEGKHRPGHFKGVAMVVNRLFEIVTPTRAYFGEKDYQQLAVIHKLVKDLQLPVIIVPCPIVRESDGLAMSSRNLLLDDAHRKSAPLISQTLFRAAAMNRSLSIQDTEKWVREEIDRNPHLKTEYFEIVHSDTLIASAHWIPGESMVGCIAVMAGKIRLIDNVKF